MSREHRFISGMELLKALCPAVGVEFGNTRRVVLDVSFDGAVSVYVEMAGDDRILQISQTLEGIEKKVINVADMKEGKL